MVAEARPSLLENATNGDHIPLPSHTVRHNKRRPLWSCPSQPFYTRKVILDHFGRPSLYSKFTKGHDHRHDHNGCARHDKRRPYMVSVYCDMVVPVQEGVSVSVLQKWAGEGTGASAGRRDTLLSTRTGAAPCRAATTSRIWDVIRQHFKHPSRGPFPL